MKQNKLDAEVYDFVFHVIAKDGKTKTASQLFLVSFLVYKDKSATGVAIQKTLEGSLRSRYVLSFERFVKHTNLVTYQDSNMPRNVTVPLS